MNKLLPNSLKRYFWEIDFDNLNLKRSKFYILKRILEFGDQKAVRWMFETFKKSDIREALKRSRGYSQKSANFWALILNVPKREVVCLKKHLRQRQSIAWPY